MQISFQLHQHHGYGNIVFDACIIRLINIWRERFQEKKILFYITLIKFLISEKLKNDEILPCKFATGLNYSIDLIDSNPPAPLINAAFLLRHLPGHSPVTSLAKNLCFRFCLPGRGGWGRSHGIWTPCCSDDQRCRIAMFILRGFWASLGSFSFSLIHQQSARMHFVLPLIFPT